jgi:hypothetical protein
MTGPYCKSQLAGLWIDRKEHKNTNFNCAISDAMPTEEQWAAERAGRMLA